MMKDERVSTEPFFYFKARSLSHDGGPQRQGLSTGVGWSAGEGRGENTQERFQQRQLFHINGKRSVHRALVKKVCY